MIVVDEPTARPARRRRARRAAPGAPAAVAPVTRVTVIGAQPLANAEAWLRSASVEPAERALASLVALHRIAAADPAVADADPARALVARVGYGTGDVVATGAWEAARELAPEERARRLRLRRGPDLRPQERLSALLAARDAALACEELTLRARADFDRGRDREAAIQLEAAFGAALAELQCWRGIAGIPRRLTELEGLRDGVVQAAAAAREGRLEPADMEHVGAALERLESALRARAASA
ncbi:hypothetical protein [Candidatus Solirubrobacter pratensis]|uniref:hypothetical protein n=1 Tax=Candidatus Solirubrobacter pratensis TaxID=1298857 RepID=UPI0004179DC5|nr:hypothetical protein [Candidatus Solirubrobacter pratensis]